MERDPARLLSDDSDASTALRDLLASARDDGPSPAQLERLQANLGALLGAPLAPAPEPSGHPGAEPKLVDAGGGAAAEASAATTAGVSAASGSTVGAATTAVATAGVAGKIAGGIAVVALAAGGFQVGRVYEQRQQSNSSPVVTGGATPVEQLPPTIAAPTPPPVAAAPEDAHATAQPPPTVAPRPKPTRMAAPAPRPSTEERPRDDATFDAEVQALQQAHEHLRAGAPAKALAAADAHAARYPNSALSQEREVLAIDALVRLGKREEAQTRAASFRARHPTSTHLIRIQSLLR